MSYTADVAGYHTLEIEGALRWYDLPFSPKLRDSGFGDVLGTGSDLKPLLRTDIWCGPVTVLLELSDTGPAADPPLPEDAAVQGAAADVAVEASVLARGGDFGLRGWEDPGSLVHDHGLQVPAGWMRMRVYAYGRGIAYDTAVSTPVEHYTVQLWPQPPSPTIDLRTGEQIEPHDYVPEPEPRSVWVTPAVAPGYEGMGSVPEVPRTVEALDKWTEDEARRRLRNRENILNIRRAMGFDDEDGSEDP